jgi:hypothetical protein
MGAKSEAGVLAAQFPGFIGCGEPAFSDGFC